MGVASTSTPSKSTTKPSKIWWSNAIFFTYVHLAALVGVYLYPPALISRVNLVLAFISWQISVFGITIGYHRLYSHRAFRASLGVRVALAAMGSSGFQGSIKWWCLRHRLHHRFTDDPVHDPYAATRGLLFSHMGWIFFKPTYEKMELVDREDLDNDPVVRFQHKHYIPIALFTGFILPTLIGCSWGEPLPAFVWGGLVARILIWHCTFLVNSLAHWDGLQPYSDEDTSRGTLILAMLTGGEGSHNFHTFPHDFRSGPSHFAWDPSKWIIGTLHSFGLVTGLRRARERDMNEAKAYMTYKQKYGVPPPEDSDEEDFDFSSLDEGTQSEGDGDSSSSSGSSVSTLRTRSSSSSGKWQVWTRKDVAEYVRMKSGRCVVLIGEWVVDATPYLGEHPAGAAILRKYSYKPSATSSQEDQWPDATWAFDGGLNNHSRAAVKSMKELRLARYHRKEEGKDLEVIEN